MGYYTNYDGCFELSRQPVGGTLEKIKDEVFKKFGKYHIKNSELFEEEEQYCGDVFFDWEDFVVSPTYYEMKGYDIEEHIKWFIELFKKYDIELSGEIVCSGENDGDEYLLLIEDNKLYYVPVKISYDYNNKVEV